MPSISQKSFKLLEGLAENNEREWFKARKDEFDEHLLTPFAEIIENLSGRLDAEGLTFSGGRDTMFRMQRDTRFSKDKSPYKTSVSGMLTPSGTKAENQGCVYLHLSPFESFAAFGRYNLDAKALGPIRDKIIERSDRFGEIMAQLKEDGHDLMREMSLSSMPRGFAEHADHEHAAELKLKSMMVRMELPRDFWLHGEVVPAVAHATGECFNFIQFVAD
ncbi:MAG: TIGR02453 family protein [Pseudomonadota bacterium]